MPKQAYLSGLMSFISDSPTPFHAVASMASQLSAAGYYQLKVANTWHLKAGGSKGRKNNFYLNQVFR